MKRNTREYELRTELKTDKMLAAKLLEIIQFKRICGKKAVHVGGRMNMYIF